MKRIHFISGLPRTGSTLLSNILAQNPEFQPTPTSGVLDVIYGIKNHWDSIDEIKANPNDQAKLRVMKGVLESYYNEDKIVFEKSRGWLEWMEFLNTCFGPVKVLVPVRDMREILSSLEKLYRKNYLHRKMFEKDIYLQMQTVEGRCAYWLGFNNPLGIAYSRIRDALQRGYGNQIYFIHFDKLTTEPEAEMKMIYKFLGEEYFEHNFNHIEQKLNENDEVYGISDLHTIRHKIKPVKSDWLNILGAGAEQFGEYNKLWER